MKQGEESRMKEQEGFLVEQEGLDEDAPLEERCVFTVLPEEAGMRLDVFLAARRREHTRSFFGTLLEQKRVLVNGEAAQKAGKKCKAGEEVTVVIPAPEELDALPEDIPLSILYEDDDLLVVDKPKGMVVHPAPGHPSGTLVNAVLFHCQGNLSGVGGVLRPGIVHRIDRDTTGALVVCKSDIAHQSLSEQLSVHSITRRYRAIAQGRFSQSEGTVDAPLGRHPMDRKKMAIVKEGGRRAVTHYRVLDTFRDATYVECELETGRTHQIRVHLSSIGHPLLGDEVYGNGKNPYHLQGQTLHAMDLGFIHPRTGQYMEFHAPLPAYFEELLDKLSAREGRSRRE